MGQQVAGIVFDSKRQGRYNPAQYSSFGGGATDEVRAGNQLKNRKATWLDHSAQRAGKSGQGD
jgi:hypothetical protein